MLPPESARSLTPLQNNWNARKFLLSMAYLKILHADQSNETDSRKYREAGKKSEDQRDVYIISDNVSQYGKEDQSSASARHHTWKGDQSARFWIIVHFVHGARFSNRVPDVSIRVYTRWLSDSASEGYHRRVTCWSASTTSYLSDYASPTRQRDSSLVPARPSSSTISLPASISEIAAVNRKYFTNIDVRIGIKRPRSLCRLLRSNDDVSIHDAHRKLRLVCQTVRAPLG